MALADLNGDGAVDIVAAGADGYGNGGAYVFFQVAATPGTFLSPVTVPAGPDPRWTWMGELRKAIGG